MSSYARENPSDWEEVEQHMREHGPEAYRAAVIYGDDCPECGIALKPEQMVCSGCAARGRALGQKIDQQREANRGR